MLLAHTLIRPLVSGVKQWEMPVQAGPSSPNAGFALDQQWKIAEAQLHSRCVQWDVLWCQSTLAGRRNKIRVVLGLCEACIWIVTSKK